MSAKSKLFRPSPYNMAGVCRFARNLLVKNRAIALSSSIARHARCMSVVAGSTQHTMSVKKRIDRTRETALLGGGQKRIDKQHQKVHVYNNAISSIADRFCLLQQLVMYFLS